MDKEFDSKLREKLDGFRPEVPAQIWDRIQTELDNKQETVVLGVQKARKFQWSRWAAAVVLITIGTIYFATNRSQEVIYLANHESQQSDNRPEIMEQQVQPAPDPAAETGGKKLSDDIRTISRVLASTLQSAESKTRISEESKDQAQNQFALNIEPSKTSNSETDENLIKGKAEEKTIFNENALASVQIEPDLNDPLSTRRLAQIEDLNAVAVRKDEVENNPLAKESIAETQVRSRFGVSKLLNLMVAQLDRRDEKFVSFSNDEEGSLKIDFNLAQARK